MKATKRGFNIILSVPDRKRVESVAARSGVPLSHWLKLAIMSACYTDEAHWEEMSHRESIRRDVKARNPHFAHLSQHLSNLPQTTIDVLWDQLVAEREKGRQEGTESAKRLAAVRRTG